MSIYLTRPGYCRRGLHEMTEENTKVTSKGWRQCVACRRAAQRRDTAKNSDRRKATRAEWGRQNPERVRELAKLADQRLRAQLEALKQQPCLDCKGTFPPECMDWDHVRGRKLFNVSQAKTPAKALEEIAKCDLVCSNCHRIRTRKRGSGSWSRSDG